MGVLVRLTRRVRPQRPDTARQSTPARPRRLTARLVLHPSEPLSNVRRVP